MADISLPTHFQPTHQTAGLDGYPAIDVFAAPGTYVKMEEPGTVTRISGHNPSEPPPLGQGGPWGLSVYFKGAVTGNCAYLTHLMKVARLGYYREGDIVGQIGDYPGGPDHVHYGLHQGDSDEAHYPSKVFPSTCYLATPPKPKPVPKPGVLPGPSPKPKWFWQALQEFLKRRRPT